MQQSTGRFIDEKQMGVFSKDLGPDSPAFKKLRELPRLEIGEVVEIKGVKFAVTRIKSNGKLGLRMLAIPSGQP